MVTNIKLAAAFGTPSTFVKPGQVIATLFTFRKQHDVVSRLPCPGGYL